ncbi:MAG: Gldg family protein [Phycisphaerales bacterium]
MQLHVITSLLRKELASYFSSPTGYVFITLFVFLSGLAAFWTPAFFDRNLANLDTLNAWFGVLLMFLIPAITMASWAEERKQGTDELLMTLPATEWELVIGKYLGCVAIYAVCLLFAGFHVVVLFLLGRPDLGLMFSTYLGYLLSGAALCGVGLAASSLSRSATMSYIAGAVACAFFTAIGLIEAVVPETAIADVARAIALPRRLESLNRGVIDPADIAYFVGMAVLGMAFTATVIAGRRHAGMHRPAAERLHVPLRGASALVVLVCGVILLDRSALRADATAERVWSLSPQTRALVAAIPEGRALAITAFVSKRVPESLVQQRERLLGLLREIESISRGRVGVKIVEPEPNSAEARDAERAYGIKPRPLPSETQIGAVDTVFLAFAVTGGGGQQQAITEFLGRGLSAEYELARAIRSTSATARKKVGILDTPAELFGAFNFQTFQPGRDWPIVGEVRKQYDVIKVAASAAIPADIDVLIAAQPSALRAEEQAKLIEYVKSGRPALILEDPLPLVKPEIATAEPRLPRNPMMGQQAPADPKPPIDPLWEALGARVPGDAVVWDVNNPHPALRDTPNEFIWAARPAGGGATGGGAGNGAYVPFNDESPVTSGLQECVLLFPGRIERIEATGTGPDGQPRVQSEFVTLMRSSPTSGQVPYSSVLQRSPFGVSGLNPSRRPTRINQAQALAARITGGAAGPEGKPLNVILVSDLDAFSETFFNIRESGALGLEFDNVTFILNCIDTLASEESLLDVRKRRRAFRTLVKIEERRADQMLETYKAIEAAEADAASRLAEAQKRLDDAVAAIENNAELDETTKRIQAESVRAAEQRKLSAAAEQIEDQKARRIEDERLKTKEEIDAIQMRIRLAAVSLPPVPALAIGVIIALRRRSQAAAAYRKSA